jgi:hypothetical protein
MVRGVSFRVTAYSSVINRSTAAHTFNVDDNSLPETSADCVTVRLPTISTSTENGASIQKLGN